MELEWRLKSHALRNATSNVAMKEVSKTKVRFIIEEAFLVVMSRELSAIFQIIIWPIVMIGLIGNFAVLVRIFSKSSKQNLILKPCYRCTLFSFALSDLMLLVTSGMNTLSIVATRKMLWIYPEWTCVIIPYLQTVAILIGSLTLAGVAIDRYIAVKPKYPRPQPRLRKWVYPIFFVLFTWCSAAAASYLILEIYSSESICVIKGDTYYIAKICLMKDRKKVSYVYTALFVIIFLPLALIFIIIHILLAINIWQRDKTDYNSEISTDLKNVENTTVSYKVKQQRLTKQQAARKNRIVKIILVLIIVFGVCRLPLWIFLICKFHTKLESQYWWYFQILLTTMSFLNAAVNPFLYAFLNEVLSLIGYLKLKFSAKTATVIQNEELQQQKYEEYNIRTNKIPREATILS